MQERAMLGIKEKLEKKFYRTKSETLRLNDINNDLSLLKNGKNQLLNEFKDKLNQYKLHPYDAKGYQNILNTLVCNRNELKNVKKAYKRNIKVIKQDIHRKENDINVHESITHNKKQEIDDFQNQINVELYENDQFKFKYNQLLIDKDILTKQLQKFINVDGLKDILLERLQKHRHIGEIKKVI